MFSESDDHFDSGLMENFDNDYEVIICIKLKADHEQEVEERMGKLKAAWKEEKEERENTLKKTAAKVATAGKVHYSFPRQPHDIKAELEVDLGAIVEGKNTVEDFSEKASQAKSLMVKDGSLSSTKKRYWDDENLDPLPRLLALCAEVEELHWHYAMASDTRIESIIKMAPHLVGKLKKLHVSHGEINPDGIAALQQFKGLETCCLRDSFSLEYYDFGQTNSYSDDEAEAEVYPYDEPLESLVNGAPNLKLLDLRQSSEETLRYYDKYCFSRSFYGMSSRGCRTRTGILDDGATSSSEDESGALSDNSVGFENWFGGESDF